MHDDSPGLRSPFSRLFFIGKPTKLKLFIYVHWQVASGATQVAPGGELRARSQEAFMPN